MNAAGRKAMCLISVAGMTIFLFLVGAFTKRKCISSIISSNSDSCLTHVSIRRRREHFWHLRHRGDCVFIPRQLRNRDHSSHPSLSPGSVKFLYSKQRHGSMDGCCYMWRVCNLNNNILGVPTDDLIKSRLFSVFVWPLALEAIGWKAYIINASWNVVQFVFVAYFWIETKGLTLEQIDAKFEKINPIQLQGIEGVSPGNDDVDNMKLYHTKSDNGFTKIEARVAGDSL